MPDAIPKLLNLNHDQNPSHNVLEFYNNLVQFRFATSKTKFGN